jgi:signal transduction histidine kinase/CheY-like chemotaxis protein
LAGFRWYVTELDLWGMVGITLTWTPLGLWILRSNTRMAPGVKGLIVIFYWSLAITLTNVPADIAAGAIVIYYAIMLMAASFLLPAEFCLGLGGLYGGIMFFCSWWSHTQIRLFDLAGLALAGLFSWLAGNLLETSYDSLHELNASLEQSNRSLKTENQQRAKLETELRGAMATVQKAIQLKSQFLANTSHEIRTPLTSIIGFSNLLQKTPLSPEQQEYIQTVRRSGDLLLALINDVLDFSKLEARQLMLEEIDFDMEYVINSAAEMIRDRLRNKPVRFRLEYPAALPRFFKGDPTRLRQIFLNLLSNAAKFTPAGEIAVQVEADCAPGALCHLKLTLSDTGIGIPKERQQEVFLPFVQGDGSTTRQYGGTGLGLTITKELVERMGGTLTLESEPGRGSRFAVCLTLKQGQPAWNKAFCLPSARELNGLGVLLIEGNPEDRMLLSRYLLDLGLRVAYVASGAEEALHWLQQHAAGISLVLGDMQLLDAKGVKRIRDLETNPAGGAKIKTIALNTDPQPGNSQWAQAAGFDGYLAKPLVQAELNRVLLGVLGDQRQTKDQIVNRHLMQEFELGNVSVLVVEDNDINRELVATLVQKMGCAVETAQNGREAVEAIKARPFDLLLMDVQMPEMDGLKATREIRQVLGKKVPIIALTADAYAEDEAACRNAGMNDCLAKPIDLEQLKRKIFMWTHP